MAPLLNPFLLEPEIEKFIYCRLPSVELVSETVDEEAVDLNDRYTLTGIEDLGKANLFKRHLTDLFNTSDKSAKISSDVLAQTYIVIDNLYPSMLEQLGVEDVYSTPYGTVVFDWEKDIDNVFSLEIGAKELGYFIERNGTDDKQVDAVKFEAAKYDLLQDLSGFLSI